MSRNSYKKVPQQDVACCPVMKCHLSDIAGLEKEAEERIANDNRNIDHSRSKLNLFVKGLDEEGVPIFDDARYESTLKERILERIFEAGASIRKDSGMHPRKNFVQNGKNAKDSVVAVGIELQVSHDLAMRLLKEDGLLDKNGRIFCDALPKNSKTYKMMQKAYKFVCDKYGAENVVAGYVHLDEYTPHMHVFVVPVATKKKKYGKKDILDKEGYPIYHTVLDAKHIFGREALRRLWLEFAEAMKEFGATPAKGLAPKGTYKDAATIEGMIASAQAALDEISAELFDKKKDVENEMRKLSAIKDKRDDIAAHYAELESLYAYTVEKHNDILSSIEELEEQLSVLQGFSCIGKDNIVPFLQAVNCMYATYIKVSLYRYCRGSILSFEERREGFEENGALVIDTFAVAKIVDEHGVTTVEISEETGHVLIDGKLVCDKDGKAVTDKAFANIMKALPKEAKDVFANYVNRNNKQKTTITHKNKINNLKL